MSDWTHLEADEEREWNSDEEHAPESNSELRADEEKDGREHQESQRRKKPQKPMLAVSPAKKDYQPAKKKWTGLTRRNLPDIASSSFAMPVTSLNKLIFQKWFYFFNPKNMNIQVWHGLTNKRLVRFPDPLADESGNLTRIRCLKHRFLNVKRVLCHIWVG